MLIVRLMKFADHYPIATATTSVKKGQVIALNSDGEAVLCDAGGASPVTIAIGISGDDVGSLTAGQLTNRAYELGNESAGSGRLTVYHGGGSFFIDYGASAEVCLDATVAVGDVLNTGSDTADGKVKISASGGTTTDIYRVENLLTANSNYYDVGIPGPVLYPVGDTDSPSKMCLVRLLL